MKPTNEGYQVNEHFWTIQGEGAHMGKTAVFIRLQGCPVGCHWCDSKMTWYKGGRFMPLEEIRDTIKNYPPAELLIITGGEPLIHDLDELIYLAHNHFSYMRIHIETSGARSWKGYMKPDWVTLSPKEAARWYVYQEVFEMASELKFVVDDNFTPGDVEEIETAHVEALGGRREIPIYLMPEGDPPRPEMVAKTIEILQERPRWRFSPRLQYDYPEIGKLEGHNNKIISKQEAIDAARRTR